MALLSDDGFLRISLDDLLSTTMHHLASGIDESPCAVAACCGSATEISGYTEWVSASSPRVSLGWVWRIDVCLTGRCSISRVGLPFSNVMLIDDRNHDYGWSRNLEVLATVVDAMPWREEAMRALS